jgi:hypothetical protein
MTVKNGVVFFDCLVCSRAVSLLDSIRSGGDQVGRRNFLRISDAKRRKLCATPLSFPTSNEQQKMGESRKLTLHAMHDSIPWVIAIDSVSAVHTAKTPQRRKETSL